MKVFAIRFSAIGDVAMLVPVFRKALAANPELEILFISKPFLEPLFSGWERLSFIPVHTEDYKGLAGLVRLASYLSSLHNAGVYLDLHDNLRTRILRTIWKLQGKKVYVLDKGRGEKAELTRRKNKKLRPLTHAVDRYLQVFEAAGILISSQPATDTGSPALIENSATASFSVMESDPITDKDRLTAKVKLTDTGRRNWLNHHPQEIEMATLPFPVPAYPAHAVSQLQIGYAPYASSSLKDLPVAHSRRLLGMILDRFPLSSIILFGGRDRQADLQNLKDSASLGEAGKSISLATELVSGFSSELELIAELDLMLSMDSGNMHLAAISGVPVIGIFGTTHPDLGFSPYGQEESGTFGLEGLECRPCTVFGNGTCYRGDFACMNQLPLEQLVDKIAEKTGQYK